MRLKWAAGSTAVPVGLHQTVTFPLYIQWLQWFTVVYLKADFFKLRLDVFHQTHVPAVDKVLPTPLL